MGDVDKAKREIRYARSAADDRRWDLLEARIRGIEAALDGVSDAERAPVLAEILRARPVAVRAEPRHDDRALAAVAAGERTPYGGKRG